MGLQEAIESPRINSLHPFSSFDDHKSEPGVLEIESRFPAATLDELKRRGHKLRVLGPYGMPTGVVAVGVNPQTGTPPRRRRRPPRALRLRLVTMRDPLERAGEGAG